MNDYPDKTEGTPAMFVPPPGQPNPKPHPVDWTMVVIAIIGAAAELTELMPHKLSGVILAMALMARTYTKWLGSQGQRDALAEGHAVGKDLRDDTAMMRGYYATPVTPAEKAAADAAWQNAREAQNRGVPQLPRPQ